MREAGEGLMGMTCKSVDRAVTAAWSVFPLQRMPAFWRDISGASAIEYAMIASGVAAVIAATVAALGTNVAGMYQSVSNGFK